MIRSRGKKLAEAQLFEGHTADDIEWIGDESHLTETIGLGGFCQAAHAV